MSMWLEARKPDKVAYPKEKQWKPQRQHQKGFLKRPKFNHFSKIEIKDFSELGLVKIVKKKPWKRESTKA